MNPRTCPPMKIATNCNYKVTAACADDKIKGFKIAFMGGQVLGFMLVGLALLILEILILCYRPAIVGKNGNASDVRLLFEYLSGYGLGGSTADLFGSLAESTCAALVVSSTCMELVEMPDAMYFPLVITGCGICVSFLSIWFAHMECFGDSYTVDRRLFLQVVMFTILMTGAVIPPIYMLPDTMNFEFGGDAYVATPWKIFGCIAMGLWSGLIIGGSTEYYTSNAYSPVQDIARSTKYGPAPVIIKGLALGYLSNIIPIFALCATILVAF